MPGLATGASCTRSTTARWQDQATGYNIAGYQKLAGQMQHNLATQNLSITAAAREYQAWQQSSSAAASLGSHVTTLQNTYGLTRAQAEQLATEAGVSAQQLAGGGTAAQTAMGKINAYAQANPAAAGITAHYNAQLATMQNDMAGASNSHP